MSNPWKGTRKINNGWEKPQEDLIHPMLEMKENKNVLWETEKPKLFYKGVWFKYPKQGN